MPFFLVFPSPSLPLILEKKLGMVGHCRRQGRPGNSSTLDPERSCRGSADVASVRDRVGGVETGENGTLWARVVGDATKEEADVSGAEGQGVFFGVEGQMSGGPGVGGDWRLPWALARGD